MASRKDKQLQDLRALVKRANSRLLRLEKADIRSHAYNIAAERTAGRAKTRFKANKSMTVEQLKFERQAVTEFLNSVSSTRTGIKQSVAKRNATMAKRYGASPKKLNALYNILSSDAFLRLKDLLPSGMIMSPVITGLSAGQSEQEILSALEYTISNTADGYYYDQLMEELQT